MAPIFTGSRMGFGRSAVVAVAAPTASPTFSIEYLVVGGGGGAGASLAGGGGAGGLRTNVPGNNSGGNTPAEPSLTVSTLTAYPIVVGSGGATSPGPNNAPKGSPGGSSTFHTITSDGGGGGGTYSTFGGADSAGAPGASGGGGAGYDFGTRPGGTGTPGQGFNGGNGQSGDPYMGGGGGGAGEAGNTDAQAFGGDGLANNITGSPVFYAGGGAGAWTGQFNGPDRLGGDGGGGGSGPGIPIPLRSGQANTGGGGGSNYPGGSGIVILRTPNEYTASFTGGVTYTSSTAVAGKIVYSVTATSDSSQTVTFN